MTMWMPLALWGLYRALARGRLPGKMVLVIGCSVSKRCKVSVALLLAAFSGGHHVVASARALWLGRGRPRRPIGPLAAGAVLAAVLIAPVAAKYIASRPMIGDRDENMIRSYSAEGPDYLKPTFNSLTYGRWSWSEGGHSERQLFPRLAPVVLTAVALWPPLSVARIAYVLSLVLAVDGSLGFNGATFTGLHAVLLPFRGLRVPARFSILAGMTLATRRLRRHAISSERRAAAASVPTSRCWAFP